MSIFDRFRPDAEAPDLVSELSEALRGEQNRNLQLEETRVLLEETVADLQLAMEDAGWQKLAVEGAAELTHGGLRNLAVICRLLAVANPLIKRGLNLRIFYVWGQGVSIEARSKGPDRDNPSAQDVNTVVQDFLDDQGNVDALTGDQAHEENERALGTDGNLCFALFTSAVDGRVRVRVLPFEEICDVIANPDDRADPWYYKRTWVADVTNPLTGGRERREVTEFYPALGYRPRLRPSSLSVGGQAYPVNWDAPVLHVKVNGQRGWKYGVPDAYAAVAWARMYQDFLDDWAKLVKALSRFAWRLQREPNSKARKAAAAAIAAAPSTDRLGRPNDTGATAVTSGSAVLEAIPKSGATIDSESGRPLAGMVAAGLDVPVTMLLGDPGITGARATAETLDRPTELMAQMRQAVWVQALGRILGYVIDSAVRAPAGPLRGTRRIDRVTGEETITLAGDTDRTVDIEFPDLDEIDPKDALGALQIADQIDKTPPEIIARLVLQVLRVANIDEVIESMLDDEGNFQDPRASAGQAAADAFRNGRDPAALLGGDTAGAGDNPAPPEA